MAAALNSRSGAHRFADHSVEMIASLLRDVSLEEIDVSLQKSEITSIFVLIPVMMVVLNMAANPKFTPLALVKPGFESFH